MKIRQGFVSNSSSSSFILSRTNNDEDVTASISINLMSLIKKRIRTMQELFDWANEYYEGDEDEKKRMMPKYEKMIQEGKEIIIGHCSNEDDDPISLAIFDNGLRSVKFSDRSIKIIDDVCH